MNRIPDVYEVTSLRNTSPIEDERVGIGFNMENGKIIRINISVSDVKMIHDSLSHSIGSSGIPSIDVSSKLPAE
ncbi:hypothetical protein HW932_00550 [Allochromatium humboldtianum]|uniref:Uncharacterized protein n=1 Tax=Allochromatium humboldtianum TaxID=504901 RepID=A0A850R982_9GAMM|nr:hypothetical protein [Allochromatium humboldtianum]NVZ07747.1 hypothetical protein [Allochromatium humboldtianum]